MVSCRQIISDLSIYYWAGPAKLMHLVKIQIGIIYLRWTPHVVIIREWGLFSNNKKYWVHETFGIINRPTVSILHYTSIFFHYLAMWCSLTFNLDWLFFIFSTFSEIAKHCILLYIHIYILIGNIFGCCRKAPFLE